MKDFMGQPLKLKKTIPILLLLTALEGLAALVFIFQTPSMEKNAWLFGLSFQRLLTGALCALPVLTCVGLALKSLMSQAFTARLGRWFSDYFSTGNRLANLFIILTGIIVCGIYLFILFNDPYSIILAPLPFIFERLWSMVAWLILICLQTIVVLVWVYKSEIPSALKQWNTLQSGLIFLAGVLILTHWIILIFRLDVLISIPGWFWLYHDKSFTLNDLWMLPVLALFILSAVFVMRHPRRTWVNLFLLILLGAACQIGFGFIEGDGFESLRFKYASSSHAIYAQHASDKPDLVKTISEYDLKYGDNGFVQTKPPGMLTFYNLTQKVSSLFFPDDTYDERFYGLTAFASYVFPFFSFLALIPGSN